MKSLLFLILIMFSTSFRSLAQPIPLEAENVSELFKKAEIAQIEFITEISGDYVVMENYNVKGQLIIKKYNTSFVETGKLAVKKKIDGIYRKYAKHCLTNNFLYILSSAYDRQNARVMVYLDKVDLITLSLVKQKKIAEFQASRIASNYYTVGMQISEDGGQIVVTVNLGCRALTIQKLCIARCNADLTQVQKSVISIENNYNGFRYGDVLVRNNGILYVLAYRYYSGIEKSIEKSDQKEFNKLYLYEVDTLGNVVAHPFEFPENQIFHKGVLTLDSSGNLDLVAVYNKSNFDESHKIDGYYMCKFSFDELQLISSENIVAPATSAEFFEESSDAGYNTNAKSFYTQVVPGPAGSRILFFEKQHIYSKLSRSETGDIIIYYYDYGSLDLICIDQNNSIVWTNRINKYFHSRDRDYEKNFFTATLKGDLLVVWISGSSATFERLNLVTGEVKYHIPFSPLTDDKTAFYNSILIDTASNTLCALQSAKRKYGIDAYNLSIMK